MRSAGFVGIEIQALGGWDAAMAQMIGLWVQYRGFAKHTSWLLRRLVMPAIKILQHYDRVPPRFRNTTMMPGMSASAVTPPLAGPNGSS